ncbi:unnamed protein product [Closterium sp. Yama58-4]|nr:unnamed protein product [Closterium sp. Yama58-4]
MPGCQDDIDLRGCLVPLDTADGVSFFSAIQLAVHHVSQDPSLLPGVKIRLVAANCTYTPFPGQMAGLHLMLQEKPIAIIGPTTSSQVALLSGLAGTTRIPLLSYSATDPLLTTSRQWPYFMRTVPSDATKMEAIADLLALYRYKHFVAIFTDDRFGRNGISVLENILQNRWGWQHPVVARVALKRGKEYDDARSSLEQLQQVRTSVMIIHAGGDGPDAVLKAGAHYWASVPAVRSGGAGHVQFSRGYLWITTEPTSSTTHSTPIFRYSLLPFPPSFPSPAVELGMFSRGYVWITTEPTSLQSFTYDGATASFMPQVQCSLHSTPLLSHVVISHSPLPVRSALSSVAGPHIQGVLCTALWFMLLLPRFSCVPCIVAFFPSHLFPLSPSSPHWQGLISMASFVPPSPALMVFRAEWKEHMSGQEGPTSAKADVYSLAAYDALLLVAQAVHNVLSGDATDSTDSQNALVEPIPPSQGPGAYNEDGAGSGSFPGDGSGGVARAAGTAGGAAGDVGAGGGSGAAASSVLVSNSSAAGQEPGTWTHVSMPVVAPGDPASSLIPLLAGAARSNCECGLSAV